MGDGGAAARLAFARSATGFPFRCTASAFRSAAPQPLDREHLARLQQLVALYRPGLFSEHLAWSSHDDVYLNDLLPVSYDENDARARRLARRPGAEGAWASGCCSRTPPPMWRSRARRWARSSSCREVVARTGCGLLLDVNNVHVSAVNNGFDPFDYLDSVSGRCGRRDPSRRTRAKIATTTARALLIDSHADPVADPVWALYEHAIERAGPVPTLIEWDNDVPSFAVLAAEAARADAVMERCCGPHFQLSA